MCNGNAAYLLRKEADALTAERDQLKADNTKAWAEANENAQLAFKERLANNDTKKQLDEARRLLKIAIPNLEVGLFVAVHDWLERARKVVEG